MRTYLIGVLKQLIMTSSNKVLSKYGLLENIQLTTEDWNNRWAHDHIGFHSTNINPHLLKYEDTLLGDGSRKVVVPLCGKSVDMRYLAEKGHQVVGVECSSKAVETFFSEQSLTYKVESIGPFQVYRSTDKSLNIDIYTGDYFNLHEVSLGKVDAIWDRASWVAMNPLDREKYVDIMFGIINADTKYLLACFNFGPMKVDGTTYHGPPFPASEDDIESFFGPRFNIDILDNVEMPDMATRFHVPKFVNYNYILSKKIF